jgi:catechol 2,3-dioxygenase-like lactoylglutathione lyase family enzyme
MPTTGVRVHIEARPVFANPAGGAFRDHGARRQVCGEAGGLGAEPSFGKPRKEIGMADMRLEVSIIPVTDVERAKQFYLGLGWRLDADDAPADGVRIVQFTPPGSGCSVNFGRGVTGADPGFFQGGLVVSDIVAAREELIGRGVDAGPIFHGAPFPKNARALGVHPDRASYASFFPFSDPDGNEWLVQEITTRIPGRD